MNMLLAFKEQSRIVLLVATLAVGAIANSAHAADQARLDAPVKAVATQRLQVSTPQGSAEFPIYADHPIDTPAPDVTRVFIVVHGTLRNADAYFATGQQIVRRAGELGKGTMIVAPQFLTRPDTQAFSMPAQTLAWTQEGWKGGEPARQPEAISSFAALDALLAHFADRHLYPALSMVIVMGHSAGAQFVQRYAVVGREGQRLDSVGISIRYVVANPSSYLYFDDARPNPAGDACPSATAWKYGLKSAPPYVASQDVHDLESRYVARNVVYLLGEADTNPYTHFIDRSCAGMAQGPYRLARGLSYFDYLKRRHPTGLNQKVVEVPAVGHDNLGMFTSDCGLAVLFDQAVPQTCPVIAGTAQR